MKTLSALCRIPIDGEGASIPAKNMLGEPFPDEWVVLPTRQLYVSANAFTAFLELARTIANGLEWNKKARIVLEYDPGQSKFTVTTFMEAGEAVSLWPWKENQDQSSRQNGK